MAAIVRLVRQICLLRERGEAAAATRLEENELATAVRDLRLAQGLEAVTEAELQVIFANEERRVADAVILAQLLIPQLAGANPAAVTSPVPRSGPSPTFGRADPALANRTTESGASTPAIPDLLDAMLAADSAARRHRNSRLVT